MIRLPADTEKERIPSRSRQPSTIGNTPEQGFDKVKSLGKGGIRRRETFLKKDFPPPIPLLSPSKDIAMKTVIVIQARLGSSRLPCKTLLNLHGQPIYAHY